MSVASVTEQSWTEASIGIALVHISTAFASITTLTRRLADPEDKVDPQVAEDIRKRVACATEEALQLKLHLEQNPSACTADGLACCNRLLEARGT